MSKDALLYKSIIRGHELFKCLPKEIRNVKGTSTGTLIKKNIRYTPNDDTGPANHLRIHSRKISYYRFNHRPTSNHKETTKLIGNKLR